MLCWSITIYDEQNNLSYKRNNFKHFVNPEDKVMDSEFNRDEQVLNAVYKCPGVKLIPFHDPGCLSTDPGSCIPLPMNPTSPLFIVTRVKSVWFLDKNKVPTITVQNTTVCHSNTLNQYNDQHCLNFPKKRKFPQLTWPTVAILIISLINCSKLQRRTMPLNVRFTN